MTLHPTLPLSRRAGDVFPELVPQEQLLPATPSDRRIERRPVAPSVPDATAGITGHVRSSILSIHNMHHYGELMMSFLRARHEVFIAGKGWDLPETEGMEFDQYDTPLARWIVIHEFGEVLAGVRLTPTTARCGLHSYMIRDAQLGLLPTIPPDLLYMEAPVKDYIWEATRLFVCPSVPAHRRAHVQAVLMESMAKTARDEGFDEIADWFETLAKAERSHANRFQKALDNLED